MGRLFDASKNDAEADAIRQQRVEVEKRAAEVDAVFAEHEELDEQSQKIKGQLAKVQVVQPIIYEEYRRPGSKWMIEHSCDGEDYIYQLFPLRPVKLSTPDVLQLLIIAMDVIFPRSIRIDYAPPNELYKVEMYTIKVRKVTKLPGWEDACRSKALQGLAAVEVWQVAT